MRRLAPFRRLFPVEGLTKRAICFVDSCQKRKNINKSEGNAKCRSTTKSHFNSNVKFVVLLMNHIHLAFLRRHLKNILQVRCEVYITHYFNLRSAYGLPDLFCLRFPHSSSFAETGLSLLVVKTVRSCIY